MNYNSIDNDYEIEFSNDTIQISNIENIIDQSKEKITVGTLFNELNVDAEAPVLNTVSIRDKTLSPGDTLYIDYDATDKSGINQFDVYFYNSNGNQIDQGILMMV